MKKRAILSGLAFMILTAMILIPVNYFMGYSLFPWWWVLIADVVISVVLLLVLMLGASVSGPLSKAEKRELDKMVEPELKKLEQWRKDFL